jgi:hypothetical protein
VSVDDGGFGSGPDGLEGRLRAQGARVREAVRTRFDVDDLRHRSARQHRHHQVVGAATAVAVVLGAGVMAAAARGPITDDVTVGGQGRGRPGGAASSPDRPVSPAPTAPSTTSAPPSSSRRPTSRPVSTTTRAGRSTPSTGPSATSGAGGGIHDVDFRNGFAYPRDECGDDGQIAGPMTVSDGAFKVNGVVRLAVDAVEYGDVTGDAGDEAVVKISCVGANAVAHAWVFAADPSGPAGVRRVALVEPDPATRQSLDQQGVVSWRLGGVRVDGPLVMSDWAGYRASDPASAPSAGFTLRQRWTGTGWEQVGSPQVSSPGGR